MTWSLDQIWRHPVKALSREMLPEVTLTPGEPLPLDRHWAVTHERSRIDGPGWAQRANFLRGVTGPSLMAVTSSFDAGTGLLTLRHPERPVLCLEPTSEASRLVDWLGPIWPDDLPRPTGLVSRRNGFTDVPEPWISIGNLASHRAVAQRLDAPDLSIHRWRANLWIDGLALWEEFDLLGKTIAIGDTLLYVREAITRCRATEANPDTGRRDQDTLGALSSWNHQTFGVYAAVVKGGTIRPGDPVRA